MKNQPAIVLLVASLFLMGADNGGQGNNEEAKLLERQKQLNEKIEVLKRDQDFLLFEKAMYASDSKYLLLNTAAKTGQLRYKNRTLRDFHFTSADHAGVPEQGVLSLTKKIEGPKERNGLIFGRSLILYGRRAPTATLEAGIPGISLSQKDFLSIFYAVENGAMAYIIR
jgi:hypothetical protein